MAGRNQAVFGLYPNFPLTEEAIERLKMSGFRSEDISALFSENVGNKEFALEKHTKAPEGAVIGAVIGLILGGILGWIISMGMVPIPVYAGPVVSILAVAAAIGIPGGLIGALVGMASPEYEARRYEGRLKRGGVLLSVHSDNSLWKKRAKEILRETGAEDIGVEREYKADYAGSEKPRERGASV